MNPTAIILTVFGAAIALAIQYLIIKAAVGAAIRENAGALRHSAEPVEPADVVPVTSLPPSGPAPAGGFTEAEQRFFGSDPK